jgi:hypothetical protein
MIFGRVPEKRQIYVSIMTFGSLVWIAVIVGIAFPSVGTFLLSFVPLPSWVDRKWVRLAMTVAAAVLPALVGTVSLLLRDPDERPVGSARLRAVLRGYPFTLGLAVTLLMMCVLAPVMKLQTLMRRWASQHIPVVVRSEDYDDDHVDSRLKDLDVTYEEWEVLFRQRLLLRLVAETKKRGGSGDGVSVSEAHGGRHPAWRGPGVEGASSVGSSEAR